MSIKEQKVSCQLDTTYTSLPTLLIFKQDIVLNHPLFGMGTFKIDYALSGPIPWKDPACLQASTVHLGGTIEEIRSGRIIIK